MNLGVSTSVVVEATVVVVVEDEEVVVDVVVVVELDVVVESGSDSSSARTWGDTASRDQTATSTVTAAIDDRVFLIGILIIASVYRRCTTRFLDP